MLLITSKDLSGKITVYPWHVSEGLPLTLREIQDTVVEVQANEDELVLIRTYLTGLPDCLKTDSVHWYGDHAKFIVACLR